MNNKVIKLSDFKKNKAKEKQQVVNKCLEPVGKKDKCNIPMSKEDIEMELCSEDWLMNN